MPEEHDVYDALCAYTLTRGDPSFIHQHVVDAFIAQHADDRTKPIAVAFALVGLYLLIEKQFPGRQVQRVHMRLAKHRRKWPSFALPQGRGSVTALDVMASPEGPERNEAIHAWCASVWAACAASRKSVAALLREHGII